MIIINGSDIDDGKEIFGRLHDQWGNIIIIRSDSPIDLLNAAILASGSPPSPQAFGVGGYLEQNGIVGNVPSFDTIPTYTYNPSGDVKNTARAAEYTALISAHNAHVALIKEIIVGILMSKKHD